MFYIKKKKKKLLTKLRYNTLSDVFKVLLLKFNHVTISLKNTLLFVLHLNFKKKKILKTTFK